MKGNVNRKRTLRSLAWPINTKIIWKIYFYKAMVWLPRISDVVFETVVSFVQIIYQPCLFLSEGKQLCPVTYS
jgi:hypothetical protein